jgi:acid stress-induced BolA-like protein IbaG/YrbA
MSVEEEIRAELARAFVGATVVVGGDGYRWELDIVSPAFEGMSKVRRQQLVYGAIGALIKSGAVHAVTIVARTPTEAGEAPAARPAKPGME